MPQVMATRKAKHTYFSFRVLMTVCVIALLAVVIGLNDFGHPQQEQIALNVSPSISIPAPVESQWLIRSLENDMVVKSVENKSVADSENDKQYDLSMFQAVPESQKNTVVYRLAYGQFLLHQNRLEARDQFEKAMFLDENSPEAVLGLALIAYAESDYQTTLQLLGSPTIRRDRGSVLQFVVEYNSAKAAAKLEQWDIAETHWQNARRLLDQPELADRSDMQSFSDEIDNELLLFGPHQ